MKQLRNESGQTLVMVALSLSVLLGFAAFATDIGVMLHEKRLAQTAADSAAIAAASAVTYGGNASNAGLAAAAASGFTPATDSSGNVTTSVSISLPPVDGTFATQAGYVEAIITQQTPGFFMRVFGSDGMTVSARAVATYLGTGDACVRLNNPTNHDPAAHPWGKSTLTMLHCGILANGNVDLGGNGFINAKYVGATGAINVSGSGSILGAQSPGIAPFSDPYARLGTSAYQPNVTGGSCTGGSCKFPDGTPFQLNQPLTSASTGVYVYTQPVTFTGTINATGVTIVLLPGASLGTANASVNLTAPVSGLFDNVLIDAPSYTGELNLDFGMSTITLNGVIYAPQADLSLQDQGGHAADLVLNADLILGTLDVGNKDNGNLTLNAYSPASGPSPMPRISLVE
ncbi:MAG: pilus assembly protein TadG-related protein [Acidobacteriaceae bacterium]